MMASRQELHVFGHHVHDAARDNFCQNNHLTTLDDLPKVPFTVVSPDFIRSVAVVVAIATSGKNDARTANGSAALVTFSAVFLLKTRDRKDGLVSSEKEFPEHLIQHSYLFPLKRMII